MISEESIREAYIFLRNNNNTIPDETLNFMLNASLENLNKNKTKRALQLRVITKDDKVYDSTIIYKDEIVAHDKLNEYVCSLIRDGIITNSDIQKKCLVSVYVAE